MPLTRNASNFIGRLSWQNVLSEKINHFRWLTIDISMCSFFNTIADVGCSAHCFLPGGRLSHVESQQRGVKRQLLVAFAQREQQQQRVQLELQFEQRQLFQQQQPLLWSKCAPRLGLSTYLVYKVGGILKK